MSAVYPATPVPSSVEVEELWLAIVTEFDGIYSQGRRLTNRGLRRVTFGYEALTVAERDALQRFLNARGGAAERFLLDIPWRVLDDPGFEKGTGTEWGFDPGAEISTVAPRTGLRHGRITGLNLQARQIIGLHNFPVHPGDVLTFSVWAKVDIAAGSSATVFVEILNAAGAGVGNVIAFSGVVTTSYTQYTSTATTIPGAANHGRIACRADSVTTTGRIYDFDDLALMIRIGARLHQPPTWRHHPPNFWSGQIVMMEVP
jgi:hypothetical protein